MGSEIILFNFKYFKSTYVPREIIIVGTHKMILSIYKFLKNDKF